MLTRTTDAHGRRRGDTGAGAAPHRPRLARPALALIVCTRDREAQLRDTLRALGALRARRPWELVVVDNGSRDGTAALLGEFAARAARAPAVPGAPGRIVVVSERRIGLARARNAGVRSARAEVLCFTDDDCYPAPDFLDRWAEVFDDPAVGYGGGRITLHDPADYPITIRDAPHPDPRAPFAYVPAGLVQGANMAFRRGLVRALGGFNPEFGPGAAFNCEDVDMAARAAAHGAAGGYFPGPTVAHHHRRRDPRTVRALERSYAHGGGAYMASLLLRRSTLRHGVWAGSRLAQAAVGWGDLPRDEWFWTRHKLRGWAHYLAVRAARRVLPRRDRRRAAVAL